MKPWKKRSVVPERESFASYIDLTVATKPNSGTCIGSTLSHHLVADEVGRVVGVAVLHQKVGVYGATHDPRLNPPEPFQGGVSGGDGPHGHRVKEVHVLRGGFLCTPETDRHVRDAAVGHTCLQEIRRL